MAKYRGYLSLEQIAEGIDLCLENARDLLEDSIVLKKKRRYPRALTCLLVAREELGKVYVLVGMAYTYPEDQRRWLEDWRLFHNHKAKASRVASHGIVGELRKSSDSLVDAYFDAIEVVFSDLQLREASLYADFSEINGWTSPSKIDRQTVEQYHRRAVDALLRCERQKKEGWFSVKALAIRREELADAVRGYPKGGEKKSREESIAELQEFLKRVEPHLKRYKARLTEELGLRFPN